MALPVGTHIGPYEIQALLGAGGMGEVYRARDTRLKRDVAVKILPEAFASDPDRLARFHREAEVIASLNHPNIAQIHGIEDADGLRALVLELIEGETLAERIARGPIPLDEALPIARQIVEALEAAHERGVVHRDLKPANIKIAPDGAVKVLDFGLAKLADTQTSGARLQTADMSQSPTITSPALVTGGGVLLGTAAYMSPEQARGKPVDKRADIWAFGCVLYEMLTGQRAFLGDDITDTLAAVVRADPDWTLLPRETPPAVQRLLRRALVKNHKKRLADIADARLDLEDESREAASSVLVRRKFLVPVGLVGIAIVAGLAALVGYVLSGATINQGFNDVAVLNIAMPENAPLMLDTAQIDIALSPDGQRLVYSSGTFRSQQLWLREIGNTSVVPLEGTTNARTPFFSPDSEWLGFMRNGDLLKLSVHGGAPLLICANCAGGLRGATWGTDDAIIFSRNGGNDGLFRVAAGGGQPQPIATVNAAAEEPPLLWPQLLPDGTILCVSMARTPKDVSQLIAVQPVNNMRRVVVNGATWGQYIGDGYLVYASRGSLYATRFDVGRMTTVGNPLPILKEAIIKSSGAVEASVSLRGTAIYVTGGNSTDHTLIWVDRQGRLERLPAPPREYVYARISPDGQTAALNIAGEAEINEIWTYHLTRGNLQRLSFTTGVSDVAPVWSPDGRRLAFASGSPPDLFTIRSDGSGQREQLAARVSAPYAYTPDSQWLIARMSDAERGANIVAVPLGTVRELTPLARTASIEMNGAISPDGRWLAYSSNESSTFEIHVKPLPDTSKGHWQISNGGGSQPVWSRDGKELFYVDASGRLMGMAMRSDGGAPAGSATVVVETPYALVPNAIYRTYDVSPDGRRFLMIDSLQSSKGAGPQLNVVINWTQDLKRRFEQAAR